MNRNIFTIGHSTRNLDEFISILKDNNIELLADIRHYPGSRKYPHFNKDTLSKSLDEHNILYSHIEALGGRRKPLPDSKNVIWHHPAFRGYADYMDTKAFKNAAQQLEEIAKRKRVVYMCSEAVWWRCHRALLSDYLKSRGWNVMHIMAPGTLKEHPYTAPAGIKNNRLSYTTNDT